jgi:MFS family permease
LTAMLVTMGAHGFGRMAYTLILPEMREGLGLNYTQSGLLSTGNFTGYLFFCLVGGFLASRYGTRIVITLCLLFMGITMLLTGSAQSFEGAFFLRFLTGLAHGGAYVPAMALGSTWFTMKRRGFAIGIVSAGVGLGIVLNSLVVPPILRIYGDQGWRFVWYYLAAGVLVICVIAAVFLRNRPQDLGLQPVGDGNGTPLLQHPESAMQWGRLYRSKWLWQLGFVYMMNGISYAIYMTFFKAFLVAEIGLPDIQVNTMWMLVGILSIFSGIIWGSISDCIGRRHGIALAYFTLAVSYIIFALLSSIFSFYISVILFGLGLASVATIIAAATRDFAGSRLAPAALGMVTILLGLGQVIGPAIAGRIADTMHTFRPAFAAAAVISLMGLVFALLLKEPGELSKTGPSAFPLA